MLEEFRREQVYAEREIPRGDGGLGLRDQGDGTSGYARGRRREEIGRATLGSHADACPRSEARRCVLLCCDVLGCTVFLRPDRSLAFSLLDENFELRAEKLFTACLGDEARAGSPFDEDACLAISLR